MYASLLFRMSWLAQLVTQLQLVSNEAEQHGSPFQRGEFWSQYLASTFEN